MKTSWFDENEGPRKDLDEIGKSIRKSVKEILVKLNVSARLCLNSNNKMFLQCLFSIFQSEKWLKISPNLHMADKRFLSGSRLSRSL